MLNSPIYTELEFLRQYYFEQMPPGGRSKDIRPLRERWDRFCDFLEKNHLKLDLSDKELHLKAKDDEQLNELLKIIEDELDAETLKAQAVFCNSDNAIEDKSSIVLSSSNVQEDNARKRGRLQLSPHDTVSRQDLFIDSGISITKGKPILWQEICDNCLPNKRFNTLILIDNYAAKGADRNLFELLDKVLPWDLDRGEVLELLILCYWKVPDSRYPEGKILRLRPGEIITSIRRRPYRINIRIQKFDGTLGDPPFHDRAFITNYNFIIAPGGIDLLNPSELASKDTVLFGVFPDFIASGEEWKNEYLNNNLYKILKLSEQSNIVGNPIMENYQSSEDCLKKQVVEYLESLREPSIEVEKILFEYKNESHTLSVSHAEWAFSNMVVQRGRIEAKTNPGGPHNEFINGLRLMKDMHFVIDDRIEYWSDEFGRIKKAKTLVCSILAERSSNDETDDNGQKNRIRSQDFCTQDECGHIIARRFGGSFEAINIVPIHNAVNKGLYHAAEQTVMNWVKDSAPVEISIELLFEDSGRRPCAFIYEAKNQNDPSLHFKLSIPNSPLVGDLELRKTN